MVPPFDIDLIFVSQGFTQPYRDLLNEAAARWESVITADVPDRPNFQLDTNESDWWPGSDQERIFGRITDDKGIDDVRVYVGMDYLERISGYASSLWSRNPSGFPINGYVVLSRTMLARDSDQYIVKVMTHELGHVLGFGTNSWYDTLENLSWDREGLDTYFPGVLAHQAFDSAGGRRYQGPGVPVQNTGRSRAHWRESRSWDRKS